MKLASPFADRPTSAPAESPPATPDKRAQPDPEPTAGRTPQVSLLDLLETRMPGLGSARLPSVADVRAYHKAGNYVHWEAGIVEWPARVYGWFAVVWAFVFTCAAWLGAGSYRHRIKTLWTAGLPGLCRSQLPPLAALPWPARLWVGWWSAVAWCGLKFSRLALTCIYLLLAAIPLI